MSNLNKEKIAEDLGKVKEEGKLRLERIRDILKTAVAQATSELKDGSTEIRGVVKEAVSTAVEAFQEKGGELKEDVTASIEGAIAGLSSTRQNSLAKKQVEVKELQNQLDLAETEMATEIDRTLDEIHTAGEGKSEQVKEAIEAAIGTLKDSEEVALLQKRYAQLKAQLAIVQANLANRYGERYDDVKHYFDDAKAWYDRAKTDPDSTVTLVEEKRQEFERKMGETGSAIAKKEYEIKRQLRELWKSMSEVFQGKH
ncbi:histidine kinase [Oscillatoria sp. FACHB-1406]|uniref:histidine kinase n=1 Tax=Oscillatoria sp. FACHB-1406 TaxID=2692846 RepID=UPI001689FB0B|nr:histidine kinase [Oscillatoria sp. FACHB-1406]MBD2577765.1 histidine kinase [Oscillatoria sp. FACHB-1406]